MTDRTALLAATAPLLDFISGLDLSKPDAAKTALLIRFPVDSSPLQALQTLVRDGVAAGWLCDRVAGDVRFSRVQKADPAGTRGATWSIDAVHMHGPGAGHTHPQGEVDLCFAVAGAPQFDGQPAGWTVYAPGTWHVPTVSGGAMDILYFLPGGAIRFEERPTT